MVEHLTASGGGCHSRRVYIRAEMPKRWAANQVALGIEDVVCGEKAPGGDRPLEALHYLASRPIRFALLQSIKRTIVTENK